MADYFEMARRALDGFPGVEDATTHGTPSLKVKGKFLTRLKEDGESLAVKVDFAERDMLMATQPDVFYITDHYQDWPMVLVHLSRVDFEELRDLLVRSWYKVATKTLIKQYESAR